MLLGQDPGLEWETRRVGSEGEEVLVFRDHARAGFGFLPDDVAEYAALLVDVVLLGAFDLFGDVNGKNGQRDELRVRVLERGAGSLAVILEDEDVLEATIFLEIENTVAECPEHVFDTFGRKIGQAGIVVRAFR